MKKILLSLLLALFLLPLAVMGQCGSGLSVIDADGNSYATVKVGSYCWMQSNLKTRVPGSSIYWADMYPDTTANLEIYGRLYNWYAAMNVQPGETPVVSEHGFVQGVCPSGWHLPTADEISQLATYSVPGLHDTHYWMVPGTNTTAYTMRPGGYYNANRNRSEDLCGSSYMWTAQSLDPLSPSIVWSDCHCDHFVVDESAAGNGLSVRCVRDEEAPAAMSVTTDSVNTVTKNSAKLHGNVTNMGGKDNVYAGFKYGTSESTLTSIAADESAMYATGRFSYTITGLTANTQYYFKAFAANGTDTVYGEVKNFTTLTDVVTDTIAFVPNGGQGAMDTMFVTRGDTVLNANTYTHGGNWHFDGWNTAADGSGTQYADQDAITTNGNLTLYAQWHTWCTGIPKTSVNEFGTSRIDSVKDIDNNKYNVVQIGNQCWLKENLRTLTNSADTGIIYTPTTTGYDVETYGRLYDWYAVMQGESSTNYPAAGQVKVQGICPAGWHVPSSNEWDTLTNYVNSKTEYQCDGDKTIAKSLASATGWNNHDHDCNVGNLLSSNNATGFCALPAGIYYPNNTVTLQHLNFGNWTSFSSATVGMNDNCCTRGLARTSSQVSSAQNTPKVNGLSVRCVRDPEAPAAMSVTTDSANTITNNTATLHGTVTNMGGKDNVYAGFKYGTSESALTSIASDGSAMWGTGQFNYTITDLTANTQYYFKAFAANGTDTVYGEVKDFYTASDMHCPDLYTVTDHEGNMYNTVQIGSQCWMAENLRCTTSPKGILQKGENGSSSTTFPWYYDNTAAQFTLRERGLLYNWAGAMDSVFNEQTENEDFTNRRGICPEGWHLPTQDEWNTLATFVSGQDYVCGEHKNGKALASTYGWKTSDNTCAVGNEQDGNNVTGFSAIASGYYNPDAAFRCVNERAYFWTATSTAEDKAVCHSLAYNVDTLLYSSNSYKYYGQSVRCVCDKPIVCEISFMPNGGMGTMEKQEVIFGEPTTLTANAFNRTAAPEKDRNWEFIGWNTKADGTGDSFANEAEVTFGSDTILYAQWHTWCEGTPKTSVNEFGNSRIDSLKDADDNYYDVVQIGNQCWMKENLRTKTSAYGNVWTNPDADSTIYGRYYDWAAVMQGESTTNYPQSGDKVRGICPEGWHVPSDAEWDTLTYYVKSKAEYKCGGSASNIAKALASAAGWKSDDYTCTVGKDQSSNNATGFSAVPAGYLFDGSFRVFGSCTDFWSATQDGVQFAWCRYLKSFVSSVGKSSDPKAGCYYSVRCLKD